MSPLDLVSIKSLSFLAVSIGSLATIKAMSITLNVSRNNVNINGDNNNVVIVERLEGMKEDFSALWNILFCLVTVTYPFWTNFYNSILVTSTLFGVPLSVLSLLFMLRAFGWHRLYDIWYVIGTIVTCRLAYSFALYLPGASNDAEALLSLIKYTFSTGYQQIFQLNWIAANVKIIYSSIIGIMGFVFTLIPIGYLIFSFTVRRNFSAAVRHTGFHVGICLIGCLLLSRVMITGDFQDLWLIILGAIQPLTSSLPR